MDGASAGVIGGSAFWASSAARPVSLVDALAFAAAANAAALSTAAAFSAAGSSGGRLRMLIFREAQPARAMRRMPRPKADLISRLPASARQACRACRKLVAAHRYCRGVRHGHKRQFSNRECLAATLVPLYSV